MSFWVDALRIVGVVAAPVLAATGVGAPLALGIGAAVGAAANAGADAIQRGEDSDRADEAAAQMRRRAEAEVERQQQDLHRQRARDIARAERAEQEERNRANLVAMATTACRSGVIDNLSEILSRMSNEQFDEIGLTLLPVCPSTVVRNQVQAIITAEDNRRYTPRSASHRPRRR